MGVKLVAPQIEQKLPPIIVEEYLDRTPQTGQYLPNRYKALTAIFDGDEWIDYDPILSTGSDDYFEYDSSGGYFKQKNNFGVRFISLKGLQFQLPIQVGQNDTEKVQILIKKIQSGEQITTTSDNQQSVEWITQNIGQVSDIPVKDVAIGQSYKVQIAFVDKPITEEEDETVGYFSTVGISKCILRPSVSIESKGQLFIGSYTSGSIDLDKVQYYTFNMYDADSNLLYTTGKVLHNSSTNLDSVSSTDSWIAPKVLDIGQRVTYKVYTVSGYESSEREYIEENYIEAAPPQIQSELIANLNYDDGYVDLVLKNNKNLLQDTIFLTNQDHWKKLSDNSSVPIYDGNISEDKKIALKASEEFYQEQDLILGRFYTLSGWCQSVGNNDNSLTIYLKNDTETTEEIAICNFDQNGTYFQKTFIARLDEKVKLVFKVANETYFWRLKLEEGKEKTPWLPHTDEAFCVQGNFLILRASEKNNYNDWNELTRFSLTDWNPNDVLSIYKDYSIEQGVRYKYAIQAYQSGNSSQPNIYSSKLVNKNGYITADFEDAFLCDGKRSLRISFNPKISSFKNTLLESKIDTLGGKYPFIFRNGNVSYKEFQISGLISLIADEHKEFDIENNYKLDENNKTALSTDNIKNEREFKLAVLDWLNNGELKLFKSPGEGNYIVRLMNVSLQPTDSLGRMLHTFSCTAYEKETYSLDNLKKCNLFSKNILNQDVLRFIEYTNVSTGQISLINEAYSFSVQAKPGTTLSVRYKGKTTWESAITLTSGAYSFNEALLKNSPITGYSLSDTNNAIITCGYYPNQIITNYYVNTAITENIEIEKQRGSGYQKYILQSIGDDLITLNKCTYLCAQKDSEEQLEDNISEFIFGFEDGTEHYLYRSNNLKIYYNPPFDFFAGSKVSLNFCYQQTEITSCNPRGGDTVYAI